MEPSAGRTVIQGTVSISAGSALAFGIYGSIKGVKNNGALISATALNSGATALTFFSIREYAVSPFLVHTASWRQYELKRRQLGIARPDSLSQEGDERLSWSELRANKILDSSISGGATGGVLRGWRSGKRAILPGALTAAAACGVLQLAYNELAIRRLKYISQMRGGDEILPVTKKEPSAIHNLMKLIGLRKMSDEEYLDKMRKTREMYMKRIEQLEQQIADQQSSEVK